jgi:uncharacterized protein
MSLPENGPVTPEKPGMVCPLCNLGLVMTERQSIEIDYCPNCRGVWLDRGELDKIIERSLLPMEQEYIEQEYLDRPQDQTIREQPPRDYYPNENGAGGHRGGKHGRKHDRSGRDRGGHGRGGHGRGGFGSRGRGGQGLSWLQDLFD